MKILTHYVEINFNEIILNVNRFSNRTLDKFMSELGINFWNRFDEAF